MKPLAHIIVLSGLKYLKIPFEKNFAKNLIILTDLHWYLCLLFENLILYPREPCYFLNCFNYQELLDCLINQILVKDCYFRRVNHFV